MKWIIPKREHASLVDEITSRRSLLNLGVADEELISTLGNNLDFATEAASVIFEAVKAKKKIAIHGDFDVDGITATAIMWSFLFRDLKADVTPFIPNRFSDGYGLTESSIGAILQTGAELIISVDCGIKDITLVDKYAPKVDFVITDHHTIHNISEKDNFDSKSYRIIGENIISAKAKAIAHPGLDNSAFSEISGAVVAWKVCSKINELFGLGIDVNKYLGLAALGTVCDVMPLVGENRIIVRNGLKKLAEGTNIGIKALLNIASINPKDLKAYHLGFVIGPRLNAAGRLDTAMDGLRLLTTESEKNAIELANKLNELNVNRQDMTKEYIDLAEKQITDPEKKILFIYGEDWPEGIIGLIAGKLAEKYYRPAIVGSLKEGRIKASARSIKGLHISNLLRENSQFLTTHGGHELAAGLSLPSSNFEKFIKALEDAVETYDQDIFVRKLFIDALANTFEINLDNAIDLENIEPFGAGNPKPVIAIQNLSLLGLKELGKEKKHHKLIVKNGDYAPLEVLSFNTPASTLLAINSESNFDLAVNLGVDRWNGNKKIQVTLEAIRQSTN